MSSAIKLDQDASRQAIDSAIRTQAAVVLQSPAFPDTTINGFLICGDEKALLMEVTGTPEVDASKLDNAPCEGQIYTNRRYRFSSRITTVPKWGDSYSIALERPSILRVQDRRRFLRAKLAPSCRVRLQWQNAGKSHQHSACLLNISADGMACRIEDVVAVGIEKRTCLKATFELPGHASPIELASMVTNKTPASEGCTILGLQFVGSGKDTRMIAALRIAIEGGEPAASELEVCV